jgi:threonine dehydratase
MQTLVSLDDIRSAAAKIEGVAVRTPLLAPLVWPGLWLKPESLQPIGAFKVRGALHAMASLPPAARAHGVITHSSGNHGEALAFAAKRFGVACVVVMPDVSARLKIDAVTALGAEVILVAPAQRNDRVREVMASRGMALIPPFDHPDVIAGQGTIGLEVMADLPEVACVLVPVGGGGLAAGVASAVKAIRPDVRVVGVEPELAADAAQSLREGQVVVWPTEQTYRTAADGLRTNLSELTLAHLRAHLAGIVTVTEAEILDTVAQLARSARLVAEPSGAVAPAAWLYRRDELRDRFGVTDGATVAVVSGGNIAPAALADLLSSHG